MTTDRRAEAQRSVPFAEWPADILGKGGQITTQPARAKLVRTAGTETQPRRQQGYPPAGNRRRWVLVSQRDEGRSPYRHGGHPLNPAPAVGT